MKLASSIFLLGLIISVDGWASPPSNNRNEAAKTVGTTRKGFLESAGAAAIGAAGATAAIVAGSPGAAVAASSSSSLDPYYQPTKDSLSGKVVVITGGTTGLGLESAKRLSAAGATIVLTSRTPAKGVKAVEAVKEYLAGRDASTTPAKLYNLVLDLDDLSSVKAFPAAYKKLGLGKIDVLMNNAGVMAVQDRELTKDGYERTFQSNHLGHFVLTAGLFPYFSRDKTTVINVSSEAFNFAKEGNKQGMDLENLNGEKQYGPWSSYGLTKLANIMFTQELQRRADASGDGSWLTAVALHPGAVSTDLGRYLVGEKKWDDLKTNGPTGLQAVLLNGMSKFIKTVPDGASTQIYLAAGADGALEKAAFYEDMKVKQNLPAWATDESKAKQLWEKSEQLGGIKFNVPQQ